MDLKEVETAGAGDIVILSGIENVKIGDTICTKEESKALKRIKVDEPTVSMRFAINNSPFAGKEGKYVQSSKIYERLVKETLRNVAIRVEETEDRESFLVPGDTVYEAMVIGEHNRENDINVNACKEKKLSNMRAAGKDDNITLSPVRPLTLERAINFISSDEMVEVTPKSIRIRKSTLSAHQRYAMRGRGKEK